MKSSKLLLASSCLLIAASGVLAEDTAEVSMNLLTSGAMSKLGGYRPQRVNLSADKPAELKKAPDVAAAVYGTIQFGGKPYLVIVDEPDGKDATLYVDANGNGDLTDDPAAAWTKRPYGPPDKPMTQYSGSFRLPLGEKAELVSFGAYRFDKNDAQRAALKSNLFYYGDYALEGQITLGGEKYHAMLADDNSTGSFQAKLAPDAPANTRSGTRLLIDRSGDGKFSPRGEMFDAARPFNIKGTTWEVADLTAGGQFKVVKSEKTVAEVSLPPDHSVGKTIMAFKATKMDGTPVDFPADYKGKIVMLDFWATWCGPCMGEVPNLVKVYNEMHPKGMEILGISLDQANSAEKVTKVTGEKGMTWPQVYDGKFWQAEIADKYAVNSIPCCFLVDGDTGEILATTNSLRGENLQGTIKAALEKKAAKK